MSVGIEDAFPPLVTEPWTCNVPLRGKGSHGNQLGTSCNLQGFQAHSALPQTINSGLTEPEAGAGMLVHLCLNSHFLVTNVQT